MSRSAARSRAERQKEPKGGPSAQVSSPLGQKLEAEDTTPGRLTRAQQMDWLMHEDAEEIVGELMDELLGRVLDGCHKVDIERKLVHFCTSWAETYITQVLQQQLLYVDEGDEPEELSKTEDPEPLPAIPDVLAPGCVPVIPPTPLPTLQQDDVIAEEKQGRGVDHRHAAAAQTNSPQNQPEAKTSPRRPVSKNDRKGFSPHPPPKIERKKKQQFAVIPKPVPGNSLPSLSCSVKDSSGTAEGRCRARSFPNHKSGPFFQPKGQQPITKLDLAALPRHCVIPLYEIVDTNCTKPKKPSALSKLESKYKKQQAERTATSLKLVPSSTDPPAEFQTTNKAQVSPKDMSPSSYGKEGMVSSESVRLNTMVLAKGVTLLDPKTAQMDPPRFYPAKQSTKLRPIRRDAAMPKFSADQITSGLPPQVTPLFQSKS
ncbi:uncharacterized protein C2orf81 homolog [Betta splendens]|uniref:Uncharacterized protein C2orf81 homolog n=1 Tax=Betta splendens TaxID=158456 RepID=A0A6P7NIQ8_BETSP|nr:uncharacterized protein C2orf81 homolog [Betta splendens]XP_029019573.1 uncharacterized protein C2orf81 homolog [Betta splendens]XP_029019574.1 uncharacterized protein C2orf81 homolog [Betta splendens]XP_040928263.1 uncharacterized protein C2orf81 homolog [Betta splendens]